MPDMAHIRAQVTALPEGTLFWSRYRWDRWERTLMQRTKQGCASSWATHWSDLSPMEWARNVTPHWPQDISNPTVQIEVIPEPEASRILMLMLHAPEKAREYLKRTYPAEEVT